MTNAIILVVEDEIIIARDIQDTLKSLGYAVPAITSSGKEALEKAAEMYPDLVLMDIRLKGDMDGVEAAQQIRARFDIPVVYLTAYADDETLQRAKITEPFGYVLKPFEVRELRSTIEMALYKHEMDKRFKESLGQIEQAKQEWESTADSLSQIVCLLDHRGRIIRANRTVERWNLGRVVNIQGWGMHELFHPGCTDPACYLETFWPQAWEELARGQPAEWEVEDRVLKRHLSLQVRPISVQTDGEDKKATIFAVAIIQDITERKRVEEERERLIVELQEALAKIKTLRGLIPICAHCKKIRDDQGYWNQLEAYIQKHSEAEFSHGICDECAKQLYPEFFRDDEIGLTRE